VATALALAITALWGLFLLAGLTLFSSWPYPNDYLTQIPRYLWRVAPQMQPYFLIVIAWMWVSYRATRGENASRLLLVAAALFAPFALFAANRWLQLRDALPLVYLSYVALGVAASDLLFGARHRMNDWGATPVLAAAACGIAAAFIAHEALTFRDVTDREQAARTEAGSWDSPYTRSVAAWMEENIPEGSNVLTSRLYFSGIHVQTDARYSIRQLPTVRVSIDPDASPMVQARSNLFRWGESDLRPTQAGDTWLHLQQFPGKGYWVGLSEEELLEYIELNQIEYVVLAGGDVAFSSNAYAWYFSAHPAFSLLGTIDGTGSDRMFGYAVDRSKLEPVGHSTSMPPRSFAAFEAQTGLSLAQASSALGTPLYVTDQDAGLSERELAAALSGEDPGHTQ
jgi:hypothetical protein